MYIHTKVQTCVGGTHTSTKMQVLPFNSGYIIYVTCSLHCFREFRLFKMYCVHILFHCLNMILLCQI